MNEAKRYIIMCVMCAAAAMMQCVAQQSELHIQALDSRGGGVLPDSIGLAAVEHRVFGSPETVEGYDLQKNVGLNAASLAPKMGAAARFDTQQAVADRYIDSLNYAFPELALPSQYAVTGMQSQYIWQRNMFANDFHRDGDIVKWDGGYVTGFSGFQTQPMLGSVGYAGASVTQQFGERWQATGGVSFNKYSVPWNAYNTYGFNGSVMYTVNGNMSLNVFGMYESSPFFSRGSNGAMALYGGYMTLKTNNDKWGVDMGAQTYRDIRSGRSVTMPIFRPFYNMNGQKLGIDLGGLLYNIFQNLSVNVNGGYNNGYVPAAGAARPAMGGKSLGFERGLHSGPFK
ncbi:MAG: hypothetical protein ACI308_11085 [Muribaculaceae bacterium]